MLKREEDLSMEPSITKQLANLDYAGAAALVGSALSIPASSVTSLFSSSCFSVRFCSAFG
jgi:hypothetical protein